MVIQLNAIATKMPYQKKACCYGNSSMWVMTVNCVVKRFVPIVVKVKLFVTRAINVKRLQPLL